MPQHYVPIGASWYLLSSARCRMLLTAWWCPLTAEHCCLLDTASCRPLNAMLCCFLDTASCRRLYAMICCFLDTASCRPLNAMLCCFLDTAGCRPLSWRVATDLLYFVLQWFLSIRASPGKEYCLPCKKQKHRLARYQPVVGSASRISATFTEVKHRQAW